jgi:hypothetical protein
LGIDVKYAIHISTNSYFIKVGELMRTRNKKQATIFQCRIIQCDPYRNGATVGEGPERSIKMPCSWIRPRPFDKRLVVPDANPVRTGQLSGHLANSLINH